MAPDDDDDDVDELEDDADLDLTINGAPIQVYIDQSNRRISWRKNQQVAICAWLARYRKSRATLDENARGREPDALLYELVRELDALDGRITDPAALPRLFWEAVKKRVLSTLKYTLDRLIKDGTLTESYSKRQKRNIIKWPPNIVATWSRQIEGGFGWTGNERQHTRADRAQQQLMLPPQQSTSELGSGSNQGGSANIPLYHADQDIEMIDVDVPASPPVHDTPPPFVSNAMQQGEQQHGFHQGVQPDGLSGSRWNNSQAFGDGVGPGSRELQSMNFGVQPSAHPGPLPPLQTHSQQGLGQEFHSIESLRPPEQSTGQLGYQNRPSQMQDPLRNNGSYMPKPQPLAPFSSAIPVGPGSKASQATHLLDAQQPMRQGGPPTTTASAESPSLQHHSQPLQSRRPEPESYQPVAFLPAQRQQPPDQGFLNRQSSHQLIPRQGQIQSYDQTLSAPPSPRTALGSTYSSPIATKYSIRRHQTVEVSAPPAGLSASPHSREQPSFSRLQLWTEGSGYRHQVVDDTQDQQQPPRTPLGVRSSATLGYINDDQESNALRQPPPPPPPTPPPLAPPRLPIVHATVGLRIGERDLLSTVDRNASSSRLQCPFVPEPLIHESLVSDSIKRIPALLPLDTSPLGARPSSQSSAVARPQEQALRSSLGRHEVVMPKPRAPLDPSRIVSRYEESAMSSPQRYCERHILDISEFGHDHQHAIQRAQDRARRLISLVDTIADLGVSRIQRALRFADLYDDRLEETLRTAVSETTWSAGAYYEALVMFSKNDPEEQEKWWVGRDTIWLSLLSRRGRGLVDIE